MSDEQITGEGLARAGYALVGWDGENVVWLKTIDLGDDACRVAYVAALVEEPDETGLVIVRVMTVEYDGPTLPDLRQWDLWFEWPTLPRTLGRLAAIERALCEQEGSQP